MIDELIQSGEYNQALSLLNDMNDENTRYLRLVCLVGLQEYQQAKLEGALAKAKAEETYYEDSYEDENEAGEYILPNSDREYISWSDLEGLSEWEVRIARNEIMARHGRKFNTESLQEYFNSCSWYEGTVEPADFDRNYETILNQYEKKNAETIKEYEKEKGYNR